MLKTISKHFIFPRKELFYFQRFFFLDKVDKYTKLNKKKPLPPTTPVKKQPPVIVSTENK